MKQGTFLLLLLIMLFCGACTRNPLGEDIRQPILNMSFTLTQNCNNNFNQDVAYNCQIITSDVVASVQFAMDSLLTTCTWAGIDPNTGIITGTPNDNQVGACQIVVSASNQYRTSPVYAYFVNVLNVAPTLTITNAAPIFEDTAPTVIRDDASVQASEEGLGVYSFDNANTTLPRCFDNSSVLSIDPSTGAVTYGPAPNYAGTCFIRVMFDDQNGVSSSTVTSEFSINVININDPPTMAPIAAQTTNEDTPIVVNFTVTDPDSVLTCAASVTAVSSNPALVPVGNIIFGGAVPNCTATITPTLNNSGATNLTFTVTDSGIPIFSDSQSFSLSVLAVNDAPAITAIAPQTTNEDTPIAVNFTITDPDNTLDCVTSMSASSSNASLVPAANVAFSGTAPNCTATITPVADQNGLVNLTFTVTDTGVPVLTGTSTFALTVTPVNDAPIISPIIAQTTNEDTPITVNFTVTDVDSALNCTTSLSATSTNTLLVDASTIVFGGTVPNCTATITPSSNGYGVTNITLTVADSGMPVLTDASAFVLNVTAVNDAPVMSAIAAQATNEDTPLAVNFTINDVDSVLDCTTSLVAVTNNAGLVPVANVVFGGTAPNCTATITPIADQNGTVDLTFTVADSGMPVLTDAKTFTLTVNPVNDAPIMAAIAAQSTNEDTPITVNFTVTDIDSALNCATSVIASTNNAGLVPVANVVFSGTAPNCTATITPVADQSGNVDLTLTVADSGMPVLTDTKTFTLTVNAINDAPVMSAIAAQSTNEDIPLAVNFTINDVDSVLDCTTSVTAATSNAGLVPVANVVLSGTAPNCTATITPVLDQSGTVNLTLTVADSGMPVMTDAKTFALTVNAVNDAPVVAAIGPQSTNEDNVLAVNFTITDVDSALNCTTSMTAVSNNAGLVPVANVVFSGTAPNCTATITPLADQYGSVDLTFTATDSGMPVLTGSQTFTLTVNPVNDAPVMSAIGPQTVEESDFLTINFTVTDVDSVLTCSAVNLSATSSDGVLMPVSNIVFGGTVPNCTATFTPVHGLNGFSNISITVNDNGTPNLQDTKSFVLTVTPFNDPPVISAIGTQNINEDNFVAVNFIITDPDNTLDCTTSMSAGTTNAGLVPVANVVFSGTAPNCTATVTPLPDQNGTVDLTLTVTDTGSPIKSGSSTFTLTVNAVNDAPIMAAIAAQSTNEDTPKAISVTITDVDSALNCATSITTSTNNAGLVPVGNVVFTGTAPNCTATITPVADQNGVVNLTFTVADGGTPNLTDAKTFTLTVNAVNDAPVMSAISAQSTSEDTPLGVNFTINDVDSALDCTTSVTTTSSNVGLVPIANVVFSGTAPNCTATITPVANQSGTVNFTFTVADGGTPNLTDAKTFTLTVNAVNDAPVMSAIGAQSTNEDTPKAVNFTINDVDSVLDCTTSVTTTTTNAGLVPIANVVFSGTAPNCTATITPVANQNGTVDFTFTVADGGTPNLTDAKTFTLTVNSINDAPVMNAIGAQSTNEDTPLGVNFTINDVDSVLDCTTSITTTSTNAGLVPVANVVFTGTAPNCTATITPLANQSGTVDFTFTVADGGTPNLTDAKTFTLTVNAVNDAPVMSAISAQSTSEDTPLGVNFTINDVDSALDCTTSVTTTSSNVGLVPVANVVFSGTAPNCTATITPVANQSGTVNFTFTVADGGTPNLTDAKTFTLTVNAVNDAPVMSAIGAQSTNEDTPKAVNFTINDVDSVLDCTTSVTTTTTNAGLVPIANVVFSGTAPNCTATITPVANQNGTVDFTFTVADGGTPNLTDAKTFTLTVNVVNDAPVLSTINNQTISEDSFDTINFTITDVDNTLDCVTSMTATSSNTALLPLANIVFSGTAPNCTATLTPVADGFGTSNVTIKVSDTGTPVQTDTQAFTLTVNSVNDAPILTAIGNQTTNEDVANVINFTITDVDNTLTCAGSMSATSSNTAVVPVANIVFSGTAPNCTATITPVADASGVSNISFIVTDTGTPVLTDTKSFTLTVSAVNDAPILSSIGNQSTNEDVVKVINFTITDVDNTLNCTTSMTAGSSNVALVPVANVVFSGTAPNCTATITSLADQNGTTDLTFTVSDTGTPVQTDFETFTLTVNAVNDAPVITAIGNQIVNEDNAAVVSFNITDVDSTLTCTGSLAANTSDNTIVDPSNIIFTGTAPNCTATINPTLNQNGAVNVTIRVTDSGGLFMDSTFSVTINAVNDAPTISTVANQTINEDTTTGALAFTIGDVDSILLCTSANVTASSNNVAVIANSDIVIGGSFPNCTVTAVPQPNISGVATITLTVVDNGTPNLQAQSTFNVTVNAVNDPPTITGIANQTINEETSTGPLSFTIGDIETGGSLTCAGSVTGTSSNTTVIPNANIVIGGTAPNCTVSIAPPVDQFGGPVTITLTVTDTGTPLPAQATSTTFTVTVINVNDAPIIGAILDQTTNEQVPIAVNFTISDVDNTLTCAGSVTATSSDTVVQPVSGIVFSGTAPNCTATMTPGLYKFGTSNITFTVSDGSLTNAASFLLTVLYVDQPPTISTITNVTRPEDNSAAATGTSTAYNINFTINDVDSTLNCNTSMSATSSNTALVPTANVTFSGTAPNCTVSILSNNNATGTSHIVLTVTDGTTPVNSPFDITYTPVNDNPTISGIADATTYINTPVVVSFTIADVDSPLDCTLGPPPAGFLIRQSLNPALIPNANIVFGGTFPNCTATITPVANQTGSGTIFIRVNDDTSPPNISTSFNVTVLPNANPVISSISDTSFAVGVPTAINFTITDANDTLNCVTSMSASSSNPAVVPNGNIVFSGTAPNCTATVTATSTGTTAITYTVNDGEGGTASTGNNVTGLTAGSVVVSQSLSTLTAAVNSYVDSSQAFSQINETVTLTLRARDTNNNSAGGGHWVLIQKDTGTSNGVLSAVTDNNDGTYTATFTGTTVGSARTFKAAIDGYPITSTLPAVTVSTVGPNCLSSKNVGSNTSGVYNLDNDGDIGATAPYQAYCDMVTHGGGWTLAAVPRKGTAPFNEASGLVSPLATSGRNANVWTASSAFAFTKLRVTDNVSAYSTASFTQTKTIAGLLAAYPLYSQSNVVLGGSVANAGISSSIGSTCFIIRGKSAAVGAAGFWDDNADYMFMGFHGGVSCSLPLSYGNAWDGMNVTQQWLISGYDGLNSAQGPEETNSNVGQNLTGSDWTNLDNATLIWLK